MGTLIIIAMLAAVIFGLFVIAQRLRVNVEYPTPPLPAQNPASATQTSLTAAKSSKPHLDDYYPKPTYNKTGRNAVEWTHVRYSVWSEDGIWHTIHQDNVAGPPLYLPRRGDIINFKLLVGIKHSDPAYADEVKKDKYNTRTGVVASISTDIHEYMDERDITSQSFEVRLIMLSEEERRLAYYEPVSFYENYDLSRPHCVTFQDQNDPREGMTVHLRPSLAPGRPGGPI